MKEFCASLSRCVGSVNRFAAFVLWVSMCMFVCSIGDQVSADEQAAEERAAEERAADEQAAEERAADVFSLLFRALADANDSRVRENLLRGILAGLEGRRDVQPPESWPKVRRVLAADDDADVRTLSLQLAHVFGDKDAGEKALATLADPAVDHALRRRALQSLLIQRNEQVLQRLESLLDDDDLAIDAIRSYAMVEIPTAPSVLLQRYGQMESGSQRAVIETLAARKSYALRLLHAIDRGQVDRSDVPVHVARSMNEMLGERFRKVFGEVRAVSADREQQLQKYKKMLTPEALASADASRGRVVFNKTCAACHLLYGEGGKVGPDLTGSNRANLDYILLNSVDPSYDVPYAYKMVQVLTDEGRVVNGVLAEEDDVRIVLKTAEQPRVVIAKSEIEKRRLSKKSMMPDGQLDQLKKQEVIDLIKYLRTTEQVELPQ